MDNFGEGSKLPSLLTFPRYHKYRELQALSCPPEQILRQSQLSECLLVSMVPIQTEKREVFPKGVPFFQI